MSVDAPHDATAQDAARSRAASAVFARFRDWRERTLPLASYQLAPSFWTPARRTYAADFETDLRPALKRREPQVTGLAHTARRLYLVIVAGVATYEHVAKLLHCRALMRADPDYAEHRGKRVSMLILCDDCPPQVHDFARRHRVRVIAAIATPAANLAVTPDAGVA